MRMPIIAKAITSDAGPPADNAAPLVTKSPVPFEDMNQYFLELHVEASIRTDGPANSDHLKMSSFQFVRKAAVGGSLSSCFVIIFPGVDSLNLNSLVNDGCVGIPFEAVDKSRPPISCGRSVA